MNVWDLSDYLLNIYLSIMAISLCSPQFNSIVWPCQKNLGKTGISETSPFFHDCLQWISQQGALVAAKSSIATSSAEQIEHTWELWQEKAKPVKTLHAPFVSEIFANGKINLLVCCCVYMQFNFLCLVVSTSPPNSDLCFADQQYVIQLLLTYTCCVYHTIRYRQKKCWNVSR